MICRTNFDEIAIASFSVFQVAIPSGKKHENQKFFSSEIPVPYRIYSPFGWMIFEKEIIAIIDHIQIQAIGSNKLPFKPILHFGCAVPVSFEARSERQLPDSVKSEAKFSCQFEYGQDPFCTVFRLIRPRFVRVYPFKGVSEIISTVGTMLADEQSFLNQNSKYLQNNDFYREQFSL